MSTFDNFRRRSSVPVQTKHSVHKFPNTLWSNIFLGVTILEALCNVALESYIFYRFFGLLNLDNITARTIPTYLAIYIFAFVFQIWLAIAAVAKRNTIQVIGLVIFNFAFLLFSAFQIKESHNVIFGGNDDTTSEVFTTSSGLYTGAPGYQTGRENFWHDLLPFLITVPCIIGLAQLAYIASAVKLYAVFGWDIYQKLGASTTVKNYFLSYQVFVVLLTYDWFFFGGFVVQLLILFVNATDWTFWVTVAALPATLIGLLAAGYAVRHELRWLMFCFNVCLVAALTYFCYQFWRIFGSRHSEIYANDRITLGIFASVSLLLLVMTLINSVVCQSFFGKADLWNKTKSTAENDDSTLLTEMAADHDYFYNNKRQVLD